MASKKNEIADNSFYNEVSHFQEEEKTEKKIEEKKTNLKEETKLKKYAVLKDYEISHKGKRYKARDIIELTDEERKLIKAGLKECL